MGPFAQPISVARWSYNTVAEEKRKREKDSEDSHVYTSMYG